MAWFTYKCKKCSKTFRESLPSRAEFARCTSCDGIAINIRKAGTAIVFERLDNGAMARAVERPHNIEEMVEERSQQDTPAPEPEEDEEQ